MNPPSPENSQMPKDTANPKSNWWQKWKTSQRNKIIAGIITLIPVVLTIYFIIPSLVYVYIYVGVCKFSFNYYILVGGSYG